MIVPNISPSANIIDRAVCADCHIGPPLIMKKALPAAKANNAIASFLISSSPSSASAGLCKFAVSPAVTSCTLMASIRVMRLVVTLGWFKRGREAGLEYLLRLVLTSKWQTFQRFDTTIACPSTPLPVKALNSMRSFNSASFAFGGTSLQISKRRFKVIQSILILLAGVFA